MTSERISGAARVVMTLAALVVVVAGLRAAAPLLVPILLGVFLAILGQPLQGWLEARGISVRLATVVTVLAGMGVLAVAGLVISASLGEFSEAWPIYQVRLQRLLADVLANLQERGIASPEWTPRDLLKLGGVVGFLGPTLKGVASLLSDALLALLTMIFVLLETAGLPAKLEAVLGGPRGTRGRLLRVTRQVQRYLGIKTLMSLLVGLLIGGWVTIVGLDFPLLWGFLAFLLHYIPNIGAILASVPAIILGVVQFGFGGAALVGVGYLVVNMVLGNLIEPYLLGQRLGLSTLVVFLSLVFWGYVWGPVGMFLSVPLTMTAKILLEQTPQLRWVGVLLEPNPPPLPEPVPGDESTPPAAAER